MAKRKHPQRPSDKLDAYLGFSIGGKYRWRRLEVFTGFLRDWLHFSPSQIESAVSQYQSRGIPADLYHEWMDEIPKYRAILRKNRASKAAQIRHAKKFKKNAWPIIAVLKAAAQPFSIAQMPLSIDLLHFSRKTMHFSRKCLPSSI